MYLRVFMIFYKNLLRQVKDKKIKEYKIQNC